jgi:medium-chain acyl-[acyl-carrier-protein] hydrolase
MRAAGAPPVHLFVANCRAPNLPDTDAPIHALPESELLEQLQRFGGTPPAVIQNPELMSLLLPTMRADFQLAESYKYRSKEPLDCPITTFGGSHDRMLTPEQLKAWGVHTRSTFKLEILPGDHYLLEKSSGLLLKAICNELIPHLERGARAVGF